MKKLVVLLTLCALLTVPALAEIDLSGMSFEELLALKEQVNLALWDCAEWQEVTVPAGAYVIGRDIPAGYWTIRPVDGDTATVKWGGSFDSTGTDIETMTFYAYEQITSPNDSYYKYNKIESVSWELTEGSAIVIGSSSVIFTPYAGVNLGFK